MTIQVQTQTHRSRLAALFALGLHLEFKASPQRWHRSAQRVLGG
jgi:hypothetical protein